MSQVRGEGCHLTPLFLSAFLDGAGGLYQARPSQEKAISLAFHSKCPSVLPLQHVVCYLLRFILQEKYLWWGWGGEGKLLKTKKLSFGFKRLMNNGELRFLCI